MTQANNRIIFKTKAEVTSAFDRQKWAEKLIRQLPNTHDGRNSWLLNYGTSKEADELRASHDTETAWSEKHNAAKPAGA